MPSGSEPTGSDDVEVGEAERRQRERGVAEGGARVDNVAHVVEVAARREAHADAVGAPDAGDRLGDLEQEARAVDQAATVAVGAAVGAVAQKLVDQVAVGAVQLDAVEAGRLGEPGALLELGDDGRDLVARQGAGRDERLRARWR